ASPRTPRGTRTAAPADREPAPRGVTGGRARGILWALLVSRRTPPVSTRSRLRSPTRRDVRHAPGCQDPHRRRPRRHPLRAGERPRPAGPPAGPRHHQRGGPQAAAARHRRPGAAQHPHPRHRRPGRGPLHAAPGTDPAHPGRPADRLRPGPRARRRRLRPRRRRRRPQAGRPVGPAHQDPPPLRRAPAAPRPRTRDPRAARPPRPGRCAATRRPAPPHAPPSPRAPRGGVRRGARTRPDIGRVPNRPCAVRTASGSMACMSVLTRDEAQNRAQLLDVHRYTIELDLTVGDEVFDSRTAIRFTVLADQGTTDTFVEIKPAALRSVTLDGQPLDPGTSDGSRLPLKGLTPGEHELRVDASMRYSRTGEGMHRFTDPTDGETYVYTQLFLDDVQRVFAAFDQPDLKAVFEVSVTAPPAWTVLANGITEHLGDGRWRAAPTPLIPTYLVAVAAGPWHSVRTEHRGLPFGLHCRRSLAPHLDADADELLDITRACFDRYHEKFEEPYPFDSYDQAFVPEFNAGAMENPGLVTFRDEFVYRSAVTDTERQTRAMVIAHEMAHMWFGDLVTLTWWDDIWLNESFAEYMGYQVTSEATRFTDTWTDFGVARKTWGYDADQRPSTHPVAPEHVKDTASALLNFDGISYAKGASALRQLVAW